MKRTFIMTPAFERTWNAMGLGDTELRLLEGLLLSHPNAGDVIPGLSGARKIRIPLPGHGKSSGGRVIYVDIVIKQRIYLLLAYPKNVQTDLKPEQKRVIQNIIEAIKRE